MYLLLIAIKAVVEKSIGWHWHDDSRQNGCMCFCAADSLGALNKYMHARLGSYAVGLESSCIDTPVIVGIIVGEMGWRWALK